MIDWRRQTRSDDVLSRAAESEQATHRLALHLGTSDDAVRNDPGAAMLAALFKLPPRKPLRRRQDVAIVEAVRTLLRDLPASASRRTQIVTRLTDIERQLPQKHPRAEFGEA
jgi:hypothetical protein